MYNIHHSFDSTYSVSIVYLFYFFGPITESTLFPFVFSHFTNKYNASTMIIPNSNTAVVK